jgi:hypothetical protein
VFGISASGRRPDRGTGRFQSDFDQQQIRMNQLEQKSPGPWVAAATAFRKTAGQYAENRQFDEAWAAYKSADRELLHAYSTEELTNEAMRVRLEANAKLSSWRLNTLNEFLHAGSTQCTDPNQANSINDASEAKTPQTQTGPFRRGPVTVASVIASRHLLDDALDNHYRKLSLLRKRIQYSAWSLAATLLITITVSWVAFALGLSIEPDSQLLEDARSMLIVVSLGALGASLSGLLDLKRSDLTGRIPDLQQGWAFGVWLPLVGAASAFVLVLLLQSGLGGLDVDASAALVAAVAAGFSERIVTNAVGVAVESIKL